MLKMKRCKVCHAIMSDNIVKDRCYCGGELEEYGEKHDRGQGDNKVAKGDSTASKADWFSKLP